MHYLLDKTHDAVWAEYAELSKQANSHLTYFQYEEKLKSELPEMEGVSDDQMKAFAGK